MKSAEALAPAAASTDAGHSGTGAEEPEIDLQVDSIDDIGAAGATIMADGAIVQSTSAEHPAVIEATARLKAAVEASAAAMDEAFILRALVYAQEAHEGVNRKSGEPYIVHPIEVAILLAGMDLDAETIAAGLLHDVVEDAGITVETLAEQFTPRVGRLVDSVTKLGRLPWTSVETDGETKESREKRAQAESLRKMFLAMIDDIGVVLIKLADRLHNMRTLGVMAREKQIRIAQQTMDIYAPLANRLGIWQFKSELEDLAFKYLQPTDYDRIVAGTDQARTGSGRLRHARQGSDPEHPFPERRHGRDIRPSQAHLFHLSKDAPKTAAFDRVLMSSAAGDVIVRTTERTATLRSACTEWRRSRVGRRLHRQPEGKLYQSLHTALIGPEGHYIEVQMPNHPGNARSPSTASRRTGGTRKGRKSSLALEAKIASLRRLMDWRDEIADAEEFVGDQFRSDVFEADDLRLHAGGNITNCRSAPRPSTSLIASTPISATVASARWSAINT
ncbi:MAG: HD domain-containing protein [Thermomicrobiales bacterium]